MSDYKPHTYFEYVNDLIGVVEIDNEFKFDFINEHNYENLLGYSNKDLIGQSFLNILHPDDVKKVIKVLKRGTESEDHLQEIRVKHKNNKHIWFEIKVKKIKDDNHQTKLFIVLKNISKIKELEEKLHENEERFQKLTTTIPEIRFWKLINPKKYEEALRSSYEMLQMVMENIPQYIYWKDVNSVYLGCNHNFTKLVNIEQAEDIIGKTDIEIFSNKDKVNQLRNHEAIVMETGKPEFHKVESWVLDNGDLIWLDTNRIPLYDSEDKVAGILVTLEDITERQLADQKLKESEEKYRHLIETSPYSIILFDPKGKIIDYNSTTEKLFGYRKEEFIGKSYIDLPLHPIEIYEVLNKKLAQIYKGEKIEPTEFQVFKKDGTSTWVNTQITLLNFGDKTFFQAIVQDITKKKEADEKIRESEEKYRDLLDSSSVGIMEVNLVNKAISYINPKLLNIFGYKRDELKNQEMMVNIIHPDDINKFFKSTEDRELEFRIIPKEGKEKWLSGKKVNHYNEKGELVSFRLWVEDVTEKHLYEELIYELNINFLSFTTNIQKNIQLLLRTCNKLLKGNLILYVHKSEKEQYQIITSDKRVINYDHNDFFDQLFVSELFHESHDFPQTFFNINETLYANSDQFIKNTNLVGCYGKLISSQNQFNSGVAIFYKNNPIITNQDKLVLFLISDAIEIEQRRWQVQQDLEAQNIMLNEINKLKTELLSRTSHELKTPLISIKGFTELLLTLHKSKFDTEIITVLEEIKDGSNRLEKIINMLLQSSKLDQGQLQLNITKEDLNFLIKYSVKELQGLAKLRKQALSFILHDKLETEFDKERIHEVISNLLINAIKYTPPGGNIIIKSEIDDNFYIISVKDSGIGLTEEEKSQLFKQFGKIERYGQGWDVEIEGTGLGLYISKKIIELHGGKIWVESEGRNKGSTFYFSIPRARN
ncbi:MAG: PAS domain S-box protein [Candidatus Hodarchaeota archaeon]